MERSGRSIGYQTTVTCGETSVRNVAKLGQSRKACAEKHNANK